jgi:hypothetical protein
MPRRTSKERRESAARRIREIRATIEALDLVCSGTLQKRTKVCGKPGCRCATDPDARHGPYYEWGRMKRGRLVNRMVTREQAAMLRAAIVNYRAVRRLLRAWEEQSIRIIDSETERK